MIDQVFDDVDKSARGLNGSDRVTVFFDIVDRVNQSIGHTPLVGDELIQALREYSASYPENWKALNAEAVDTLLREIVQMLEHDDESIDLLASKLNTESWVTVIIMFGWFGAKARRLLPVLINYAGSSHAISTYAYHSVLLIGGAQEEILSALRNSVAQNDDEALLALGHLAIGAGHHVDKEFKDILDLASESSNPILRETVAVVIAQIDRHRRAEFTAILDRLRIDPDENVRQAAREIT